MLKGNKEFYLIDEQKVAYETVKKLANIILVIGIVLTLIGAIYIAIVQQAYAISGCFILASVLMGTLLLSKKK